MSRTARPIFRRADGHLAPEAAPSALRRAEAFRRYRDGLGQAAVRRQAPERGKSRPRLYAAGQVSTNVSLASQSGEQDNGHSQNRRPAVN